jgi:hypothetical protein
VSGGMQQHAEHHRVLHGYTAKLAASHSTIVSVSWRCSRSFYSWQGSSSWRVMEKER